jgi:tetratricopeptide (TPR) repeat protein
MSLSLTYPLLATVLLSAVAALGQLSPELTNNPAYTEAQSTVFITGKVLADDGSLITGDIALQTICGDQVFAEGYADRQGDFQFQMNGATTAQASPSAMQALGSGAQVSPSELSNCELRANIPGFISSKFSFAGKVPLSQINVGTIYVHRVRQDVMQNTSQTIALSDLAAPPKAKKDFNKGEDFVQKKDWKSAQQAFQKALDRYPRFAIAWSELARTQRELGDLQGAQQSLYRAVEVDPRFLPAYAGLSDIALQSREWKNLQYSTDRLLSINSETFPQFWLLNAVACYNLGFMDQAETAVLHGLRLDQQHRYPKMEHLFGMILGIKHQYAAAATHLQNYLRLEPSAPDASAVQVQLNRFQQLATRAVGK